MVKKLFIFSAALLLPLVLAACQTPAEKVSEKASEAIAEKAIEQSTGGQADVDISGKNVNINTKEGSMQAGENVKLPADWPSDIYVFEGTLKAVITANDPKGYSVSIETDKSVADIKAAYEKKIVEDGWKKTGSMDFGETASVSGEKDNRTMSVIISASEGKTTIVLNLSEAAK